MPSWLECANGHGYHLIRCRDAAILLARGASTPGCSKPGCTAPIRYCVSQTYPSTGGKGSKYQVIAVERLWQDADAERNRYDPMLLLLRDLSNGEQCAWPFYWTKNRHGKWHVGQYPPLLSVREFQNLLSGLRRKAPHAGLGTPTEMSPEVPSAAIYIRFD